MFNCVQLCEALERLFDCTYLRPPVPHHPHLPCLKIYWSQSSHGQFQVLSQQIAQRRNIFGKPCGMVPITNLCDMFHLVQS